MRGARPRLLRYADHVEEQRAAILDLVHDLLRDAVIIQGIGIVLGAVTAGTTAAGATALNAAQIAAAAPRLLRIIELLRTLASTCAAPMRLAASALRDVRRRAGGLPRARTTVASAYDAERLARVARLRGIVQQPAAVQAQDLRGLSRAGQGCGGWPVGPASEARVSCTGIRCNNGRQIRVMDGYPPGTRPDPITEGPYAVVSQNGASQDPARREPDAVTILDELLEELEETLDAEDHCRSTSSRGGSAA